MRARFKEWGGTFTRAAAALREGARRPVSPRRPAGRAALLVAPRPEEPRPRSISDRGSPGGRARSRAGATRSSGVAPPADGVGEGPG